MTWLNIAKITQFLYLFYCNFCGKFAKKPTNLINWKEISQKQTKNRTLILLSFSSARSMFHTSYSWYNKQKNLQNIGKSSSKLFGYMCNKKYILLYLYLWFMAHGSWLMAHGLWLMAYGLWLMAYGLWLMAHGSWLMAHGLWLMAHGSWLMALEGCTNMINNLFPRKRKIRK